METVGPINSQGLEFFSDFARRISRVSDDVRKRAFLFQRLSVMQRFNSVAVQDTSAHTLTSDFSVTVTITETKIF